MIYTICPNCGNKTLRVAMQLNYIESDDTVTRIVACNDCDATWLEVFEVTKSVLLTIPSTDYEMIDHELVRFGKEE